MWECGKKKEEGVGRKCEWNIELRKYLLVNFKIRIDFDNCYFGY